MLIVIAHNNGSKYLDSLILSLGDSNPVCVVDTGSTESELRNAFSVTGNIIFANGGFCANAYRVAYESFSNHDSYFFMHDSMICKWRNFEQDFRSSGDVVAWIGIGIENEWINDEYIQRSYPNVTQVPNQGMFGPIFYATNKAMRKLKFPAFCHNRADLCSSERGFGFGFMQAGFDVKSVDSYCNDRIDNKQDYKHFDKFRPNRP